MSKMVPLSISEDKMKDDYIRHRQGRKGIVDVQFNWIFVMIAGVTIFIFIISIAFSQKNAAEERAGISTLSQIMTLLKNKQQTPDVYSEISFPRTDITFSCTNISSNGVDKGSFEIKISKSQPSPFGNEIIFAPKEMTTDKMIVWTKAFDTGFPVGVFVYVTTADTAVVIYNDTDSARYASEIYAGLPSNITKNKTTDLHAYRGYKNLKIICFGDEQDNSCPIGSGYNYIMITPGNSLDSKLFDYGNVTFYNQKTGRSILRPYLSEAGLYGAIFSDSAGYYDCQMIRMIDQFEVKRLLTERRLFMINDALPESYCKEAINLTLEKDVIPLRDPVMNYENVTEIGRNSRDLDIRNENLIINSCPTIY